MPSASILSNDLYTPSVSRQALTRSVRSFWAGLLSLSSLALTATTGFAAEEVYVDYSLLSRSIPTVSLEQYAETGEADEFLAPYLEGCIPVM